MATRDRVQLRHAQRYALEECAKWIGSGGDDTSVRHFMEKFFPALEAKPIETVEMERFVVFHPKDPGQDKLFSDEAFALDEARMIKGRMFRFVATEEIEVNTFPTVRLDGVTWEKIPIGPGHVWGRFKTEPRSPFQFWRASDDESTMLERIWKLETMAK